MYRNAMYVRLVWYHFLFLYNHNRPHTHLFGNRMYIDRFDVSILILELVGFSIINSRYNHSRCCFISQSTVISVLIDFSMSLSLFSVLNGKQNEMWTKYSINYTCPKRIKKRTVFVLKVLVYLNCLHKHILEI